MNTDKEFENFINQVYNNSGGFYRPYTVSSLNQDNEDMMKSLTEYADKYCDKIYQRRKGKHKQKFTEEEFDKICEELGLVEDKSMFEIDRWLSTLNEDYHRPKSPVRRFQLGNLEVRVWSYDNGDLLIDEVKFQITPDGELDVHVTGQTTLHSLQELSDTVNLYRKSYKVMIETAKQLKLLRDF